MRDAWKNDPYELPILKDVAYRCSCGCAAKMMRAYGGPAYASHWYYAIKCLMPACERHTTHIDDWNDTPAEAIRAWNRRCLEASE